ncbi:mechanosensitive ion channel domain-containing protein [uncultured Kordia sp.]|uniref:mechanosensitive ion channel family protein n=1 Tax=uncultured Kordia sp. TaxID=507699 RepID=UPI00262A9372|nr:mechanosensitive ion channel domain-containing protein [uncultured Kordia sp.]
MEYINSFLDYILINRDEVKVTVRAVVVLISVLIATHLFLRYSRIIVTRNLEDEGKARFKTVFTFLKYFIFSIVIITSLDATGVQITAILAASTALFVGLGLGMQKLFQDIISGIFILIDRTITVNDIIQISGKIGKITKVGLRTTKAVTQDEKILVIPNHKFLSEILYNWTQNDVMTRESIDIGVAYGTDVDLVKALLLGIVMQEPAILNEPKPTVFFTDFGDSALKFKLHFYIGDSFHLPEVQSKLRYKVYKTFNENNISIPFPQRDVHVYNSKIE